MAAERPLGARYRIDGDEGSWWELGWDRPLGTFYAQHLVYDRHEREQILDWKGMELGELPTTDDLAATVPVPVPAAMLDELRADQEAHPHLGPPPFYDAARLVAHQGLSAYQRWLNADPVRAGDHIEYGHSWIDPDRPGEHHRLAWIPGTGELYTTDGTGSYLEVLATISDRDDLEDALAGWGQRVGGPAATTTWIHHRLDQYLWPGGPAEIDPPASPDDLQLTGGGQADPSDARTTVLGRSPLLDGPHLPAEPVANVLRALQADPYTNDDDLTVFATGLGLAPDLVGRVVAEPDAHLTVDDIERICDGLRCSPYDIWEPDQVRAILNVYGPERWPEHVEPLPDAHSHSGETSFLARRLDHRAAERDIATTPVVATCYRRTGVVAMGEDGSISRSSELFRQDESDAVHHFTFETVSADLPVPGVPPSAVADGPLPGIDAHPRLVQAANELADRHRGLEIDLVHLSDPVTGNEEWIGWDDQTATWQTWDDPRLHYPDDPEHILRQRDDMPAMHLTF